MQEMIINQFSWNSDMRFTREVEQGMFSEITARRVPSQSYGLNRHPKSTRRVASVWTSQWRAPCNRALHLWLTTHYQCGTLCVERVHSVSNSRRSTERDSDVYLLLVQWSAVTAGIAESCLCVYTTVAVHILQRLWSDRLSEASCCRTDNRFVERQNSDDRC